MEQSAVNECPVCGDSPESSFKIAAVCEGDVIACVGCGKKLKLVDIDGDEPEPGHRVVNLRWEAV